MEDFNLRIAKVKLTLAMMSSGVSILDMRIAILISKMERLARRMRANR